ncbi:hypothetical protein TSAR_000129 [Trichomalopsis sarcophagae]|uniref:Uncharacterized protein n=1 Tax=Trichomalopsis sarcophagae TaxID=543379 RepID=A0A232F6R1_9HYME|nr:hypothetical protein TSAR_000129 [Trichomalopsis sarcophagae]
MAGSYPSVQRTANHTETSPTYTLLIKPALSAPERAPGPSLSVASSGEGPVSDQLHIDNAGAPCLVHRVGYLNFCLTIGSCHCFAFAPGVTETQFRATVKLPVACPVIAVHFLLWPDLLGDLVSATVSGFCCLVCSSGLTCKRSHRGRHLYLSRRLSFHTSTISVCANVVVCSSGSPNAIFFIELCWIWVAPCCLPAVRVPVSHFTCPIMTTLLDDSNVSKRRCGRSHFSACDLENCQCFGTPSWICITCNLLTKFNTLDYAQEKLICYICAPAISNVASHETVSPVKKLSGAVAGDVQSVNISEEFKKALQINCADIKSSLAAIDFKLTDFNTRISENNSSISEIRLEITILQSRMQAVEDLARESPNNPASPQSTVDLTSELQDRMSRFCNMMIYNVPVRQCLARISNLNLSNLTVRRFAKPSARSNVPRVLARFGSQFEAQRVINNRKFISDGVEAAADRIQYQKELFERLRAEVLL